jgi:hypothetical protein
MNRYHSPREGSRRAQGAERDRLGPGAFASLECGKDRGPLGELVKRRPFKWLDLRQLWLSRNDRVAAYVHDPVEEMRVRWLAALEADRDHLDDEALTVELGGAEGVSCLVLGDTGEGDASQCAVVPPLLAAAEGTSFLFLCSDVIYPAGEGNHYPVKFYEPYDGYAGQIYAIPGNHDWYDELNGFMFHLCGAEAPGTWKHEVKMPALARLLWRKPRRIGSGAREARERRPPGRSFQPGPYFAIDAGSIFLVGIDTGISGGLDRRQGEWLRRISANVDKPKVLLTGKPIYVDGEYRPGHISNFNWTVDEIVRDPSHRYLAAIGGDIHNYQRYPVRLADGRTIEYIVSGGGGAFMHATHRIPPVDLDGVNEEGSDPNPERGDGFRCFPLRGASLAFYSRAMRAPLRKLIYDALLVGLLFAALAAALLLWRAPRLWAIEVAVLLAVPTLVAVAVLIYLGRLRAYAIAFGRVAPLTAEEGSAWIADRLGSRPTVAPELDLPAEKRRLAQLIYPRFQQTPKGFLHTFLSEIFDLDEPPLYKQFLRLDADPAQLRIRCFAAIGTEAAGDAPALEDEVVIELPDRARAAVGRRSPQPAARPPGS